MDNSLFNNTKLAAYILWESSDYSNALDLWYCAEDIACYFEHSGLLTKEKVYDIISKGIYSTNYIYLIRNLAYRVYIYTGHNESRDNWSISEKLVFDTEWLNAIIYMSQYYNLSKSQTDFLDSIRSDKVKSFYNPFTQIF